MKTKQQSHEKPGAKKKRMLLQKELHSKLEKNLAHLADVRFVSTVKGAQNYSILLLPKS